MVDCLNKRLIGRNALLEFAVQCVDEDPAGTTFLPLGAVTTKSLAVNGNVIESNDSFNESGFTENQMTSRTITLSASGNCVRNTEDYANAIFVDQLIDHFMDTADQTLSREPVVLIRYTRGNRQLVAYMLINNVNLEDPDAEYSTYSSEFSLATSPMYPPKWSTI